MSNRIVTWIWMIHETANNKISSCEKKSKEQKKLQLDDPFDAGNVERGQYKYDARRQAPLDPRHVFWLHLDQIGYRLGEAHKTQCPTNSL